MNRYELRDVDDVRTFVAQGLWLRRAQPPTAGTVKQALEQALPPLTRNERDRVFGGNAIEFYGLDIS